MVAAANERILLYFIFLKFCLYINATFINGKFIGNLKEILKEKNNEDDDEEIKEESISSLNSA